MWKLTSHTNPLQNATRYTDIANSAVWNDHGRRNSETIQVSRITQPTYKVLTEEELNLV